MNRVWTAVLVLMVAVGSAQGQFRTSTSSGPHAGDSMVRSDDSGLMFGWFDPNRLIMHQSYSLSYTTMGGHGMSIGMYTNSLMYQFSDPLSVRFDVSLVHSPFGNFGGKFGQDISGIYLTRAELNYRPSQNTLFQVQFRQVPTMYWMPGAHSWDFLSPLSQEEEPN